MPGVEGDARSQHTSTRLTEHVETAQIASIVLFGDAYGNALIERKRARQNRVHPHGVFLQCPYKTASDVESATAAWVQWYSNYRLAYFASLTHANSPGASPGSTCI